MVKVIVGMMGSSVTGGSIGLSTPIQVQDYLDCVERHNIKELDTARVYAGGKSETLLGVVSAHSRFAISTKAPAFVPHSLSAANIITNCNKSLVALKQDKVDIYYLHGPDRATSLEEQCRAIGKLYSEGKFERFGVSNISDTEVQTVYNICKREGYPLPSVYQGGYNPIARGSEATLLPLLRELNISFYAFSPLAGGLLAKVLDEILNPTPGTRYEAMKIFGDMYLKKLTLDSLTNLKTQCDEQGVSVMEATLRWFLHHSPLAENDGLILGASSTQQIDSSLTACEQGPLSYGLAKAFEDLWAAVKVNAPPYHS